MKTDDETSLFAANFPFLINENRKDFFCLSAAYEKRWKKKRISSGTVAPLTKALTDRLNLLPCGS